MAKGKASPSTHNSKSAPRLIETRENRLRALELRKQGLPYRKIGEVMGCRAGTAHQWVMWAFRELIESVNEAAEDVRKMELDRLDSMQAALWNDCEAGDKPAIAATLRIMERRSKLLGLDSPQQVDQRVTIQVDRIDEGLSGNADQS